MTSRGTSILDLESIMPSAARGSIKCSRFMDQHLEGVVEICRTQGSASFCAYPRATLQALTAPGVTALVALKNLKVLGFAYLQSDGTIQAHRSLIAVRPEWRGRGIARRLLETGFANSGVKRIDLISTESGEDFYRSFCHRELPAFDLSATQEQGSAQAIRK